MSHEELMKSFKAITDNIKKTDNSPPAVQYSKRSVDNGHNTDPVDATPSSQPTGSKWTFDAVSKNIKAALNINSTNAGAIKDILGLPLRHQLTLLGAISERYISLFYLI